MKKYINGYSNPAFIYYENGMQKRIDLSFKYQALYEYVDEYWVEHMSIDGKNVKKFLFAHYEFELDYSQYIESTDMIKLVELINKDRYSKRIIIIPHTDHDARFFEVTRVNDRYGSNIHHGGRYAPGNKDFVLKFRTINPQYTLDWGIVPDVPSFTDEDFILI